MKPKTLILMFVAVGCGLLAAFVVAKLPGGTKENTVDVLVTRGPIAMGTVIDNPDGFFEPKKFREDSKPPNALSPMDLDKLKGKQLGRALDPGHLITMKDFSGQSNLTTNLKDGEVAIAVPVKRETVAGGFVQPGSTVNIIADIPNPKKAGGPKVTATILQNIRVLAVDTAPEADASKQTTSPTTVTLAMTPQQTQQLHLAMKLGSVTLGLRKPGDNFQSEPGFTTDPLDMKGTPFGGTGTKEEQVEVAVSISPIPAGTIVKEPSEMFEMLPYSKASTPKNAITSLERLKGKTIYHDLDQNTPATTDIFKRNEKGGPIVIAQRRESHQVIWNGDKLSAQMFVDGKAVTPRATQTPPKDAGAPPPQPGGDSLPSESRKE